MGGEVLPVFVMNEELVSLSLIHSCIAAVAMLFVPTAVIEIEYSGKRSRIIEITWEPIFPPCPSMIKISHAFIVLFYCGKPGLFRKEAEEPEKFENGFLLRFLGVKGCLLYTSGTVGEDIFCERAQGAHLHFELIENNLPLDPAEYWG